MLGPGLACGHPSRIATISWNAHRCFAFAGATLQPMTTISNVVKKSPVPLRSGTKAGLDCSAMVEWWCWQRIRSPLPILQYTMYWLFATGTWGGGCIPVLGLRATPETLTTVRSIRVWAENEVISWRFIITSTHHWFWRNNSNSTYHKYCHCGVNLKI